MLLYLFLGFTSTAFDDVITSSAGLLGEQMGTVLEHIARNAICAGTNVQFAGGGLSRSDIGAANTLTVSEFRKAICTLKRANVRMFTRDCGKAYKKPHLVCVCSLEATYDLQSDPLWQDISKYSRFEQIYKGEMGRLFGVVFVEAQEAMVFQGEGAIDLQTGKAIDVHTTLLFGADAYGVVDFAGVDTMQTILTLPGSAGTNDPLNQKSTVGVKVAGYAATILNPLWIVRIEHAATI